MPTLRWTKTSPGARPRISLACVEEGGDKKEKKRKKRGGGGLEGWGGEHLPSSWARARAPGPKNHAPPPALSPRSYRHPRVRAPDPQELGRLRGDQALKVVRPGGPHGVRPLAVCREKGEAVRAGEREGGNASRLLLAAAPILGTSGPLVAPRPPGTRCTRACPAQACGHGCGARGGIGPAGHVKGVDLQRSLSLSFPSPFRDAPLPAPPHAPPPPATYRLFLRTSFMEAEAEVTPIRVEWVRRMGWIWRGAFSRE